MNLHVAPFFDSQYLSPQLRGGAPRRRDHSQRAFTLVEVLVSVTVLALLLVMVAQMVNSATNVTKLSQQHVDADNAARTVFERMEHDFGGMIRRPDVDCSIYPYDGYHYHTGDPVFKNPVPPTKPSVATATSGKNDYLFFYSQVGGYTMGASSDSASVVEDAVSAIGYRIWESSASTADTPYFALERLAFANSLDVGKYRPMLFLASTSGTGSYTTNPAVVDLNSTLPYGLLALTHPSDDVKTTGIIANIAHVLSDQVFRLEFALEMTPAYFAKSHAGLDVNGNSSATGPYWQPIAYNGTPLNSQIQDMRNVAAIVVTIAVLDNSSRLKIPGYNSLSPTDPYKTDMAQLSTALVDGNTPSVANLWAATVNKLATSTETPRANISAITRKIAAQNVRIYQRTFYLK